MRTYCLITAILLAGCSDSEADSIAQVGPSEKTLQVCADVSQAAETAMTARQKGVPIHQMLKVVDGVPDDGSEQVEVVKSYYRRMVIDAYKQPFIGDDLRELQKETIREFTSTVYTSCVDSGIE